MRLIGAALTAFVLISLAGAMLGSALDAGSLPEPVLVLGIWAVFLIVVGACYFLFNRPADREFFGSTLEKLEEQELVESVAYRATRAFKIAEVEDAGRHFFVELNDGGVLYLNGQYLYDFDAKHDGATPSEHGYCFPCTEFLIQYQRDTRRTLDLIPVGTPLETEEVIFPSAKRHREYLTLPKDRDIVRDQSYDEIKREWLRTQE